jgi:hypothetical protein
MNNLRYYIDLLNEAAYDNKIMALKKLYPDQSQIIDWGKRLKKPDRVMWYLNILDRYLKLSDGDINKPIPDKNELIGNQNNTFADFQNSLEHYLGQENIPKIQSYVFTNQSANDVFSQLSEFEQDYIKLQAKTKGVDPQTNDYKLIEFPDGTNWWFIDRAYCPEEGRSGGHCGNVVGQHDTAQRILSYRDRNNRVILTFILESDKRLGEMKAKFNQKPEDRYHPQIMSLLLNPIVQGIKGEGYLADTNFSVFDLDERYLKILQAQKPKLISDQLATTPVEILKSPDWIKQNEQYKKIVLQKSPALRELLENQSIDNWELAVMKDSDLIVYAPDDYPNYRNALLNYLYYKNDPAYLLKVRNKYRKDFEFLSELLSKSWRMLGAIPTNTPRYRDLAMIAINRNGLALSIVPEELTNYDMCLTAVFRNGKALEYVPEKLKDYEMCLTAVNNGESLENVPEDLQLKIVRKTGIPLYQVPDNLRNREICLLAMKHDGKDLAYVPDYLRDYEMCLTAVKQNGKALEDVPEELPKFREICVAAVEQNGLALEFVPGDLLDYEYKMCLTAVKQHGDMLIYVPEHLRDYKMCLTAVKQNGFALPHVLDYLPEYREICLAAVKQNGLTLYNVPYDLRKNDFEICLAAVKQNGEAIRDVPLNLQPEIEKALEKEQSNESINRLKQMAGIN